MPILKPGDLIQVRRDNGTVANGRLVTTIRIADTGTITVDFGDGIHHTYLAERYIKHVQDRTQSIRPKRYNRFDDWRNGDPYRKGYNNFFVGPLGKWSYAKINHAIEQAKRDCNACGHATVALNISGGPFLFEYAGPTKTATTRRIFKKLPSATGLQVYMRTEWS